MSDSPKELANWLDFPPSPSNLNQPQRISDDMHFYNEPSSAMVLHDRSRAYALYEPFSPSFKLDYNHSSSSSSSGRESPSSADSIGAAFYFQDQNTYGIHSRLAVGTRLQFDLYYQPPEIERRRNAPASLSNAGFICIPIEVFNQDHAVITCYDLLLYLYRFFQVPLTDAEWTFASRRRRQRIKEAQEARQNDEPGSPPRRIDWLGQRTIFGGFTKVVAEHDELAFLPGKERAAETWYLRLHHVRPDQYNQQLFI
ncbi:hypothetical protein SISSUDRAFT_1057591 [Sistotremastrum suecicum HHB10207 ss-3]|uniref:DUF6699 domain-containing protein n=1 Tax=Sistotremastrum suecicum HHB10207 ss-3 TaxID=1314776 RepID=A0A166IBI8_9AGAM|nr:hypothetical protein SISSUDRAFT_1057591 [Sistotremastrum suecicum HHB10207 ss-3]